MANGTATIEPQVQDQQDQKDQETNQNQQSTNVPDSVFNPDSLKTNFAKLYKFLHDRGFTTQDFDAFKGAMQKPTNQKKLHGFLNGRGFTNKGFDEFAKTAFDFQVNREQVQDTAQHQAKRAIELTQPVEIQESRLQSAVEALNQVDNTPYYSPILASFDKRAEELTRIDSADFGRWKQDQQQWEAALRNQFDLTSQQYNQYVDIKRDLVDRLELPKELVTVPPHRRSPQDLERIRSAIESKISELNDSRPFMPSDAEEFERQKQIDQDIDTLEKIFDREKGFTVGEAWENAAMSFMQSLVDIPASTLMGIGVLSKALDDWTGIGEYEGEDATELATFQIGNAIRQWAEKTFPRNENLQGRFFADTFPAALASFAGYVGGGAASRLLTRGVAKSLGKRAIPALVKRKAIQKAAKEGIPIDPVRVAREIEARTFRLAEDVAGSAQGTFVGTTATASGAETTYREAKERGVTEDQALLAGVSGTIGGALQIVPVMRALSRFNKRSGGTLFTRFQQAKKAGFKGGIEEFMMEGLGNVWYDATAEMIYNYDPDYFDTFWTSGGTAGPAAAVTNFMLAMMPGKGFRGPLPDADSPLAKKMGLDLSPHPINNDSDFISAVDEYEQISQQVLQKTNEAKSQADLLTDDAFMQQYSRLKQLETGINLYNAEQINAETRKLKGETDATTRKTRPVPETPTETTPEEGQAETQETTPEPGERPATPAGEATEQRPAGLTQSALDLLGAMEEVGEETLQRAPSKKLLDIAEENNIEVSEGDKSIDIVNKLRERLPETPAAEAEATETETEFGNISPSAAASEAFDDPTMEGVFSSREQAKEQAFSDLNDTSLIVERMIEDGRSADEIMERLSQRWFSRQSPLRFFKLNEKDSIRKFLKAKTEGIEQRTLEDVFRPSEATETTQTEEVSPDEIKTPEPGDFAAATIGGAQFEGEVVETLTKHKGKEGLHVRIRQRSGKDVVVPADALTDVREFEIPPAQAEQGLQDTEAIRLLDRKVGKKVRFAPKNPNRPGFLSPKQRVLQKDDGGYFVEWRGNKNYLDVSPVEAEGEVKDVVLRGGLITGKDEVFTLEAEAQTETQTAGEQAAETQAFEEVVEEIGQDIDGRLQGEFSAEGLSMAARDPETGDVHVRPRTEAASHVQLLDQAGLDPENVELGFVSPEGKFLNRSEAAEYQEATQEGFKAKAPGVLMAEELARETEPTEVAGVETTAETPIWQIPLSQLTEGMSDAQRGQMALQHAQQVEQALKQGKSVPQDVLQDYPLTAQKYGQFGNMRPVVTEFPHPIIERVEQFLDLQNGQSLAEGLRDFVFLNLKGDSKQQARNEIFQAITGRTASKDATPTDVNKALQDWYETGATKQFLEPGENYRPLDRTKSIEGTSERTYSPKRREPIIAKLLKGLNIRIFRGGIKGKTKLGHFIPKTSEIRIKNRSDLEVTAHEVAHLIDRDTPELSKQYRKNPFRDELKGLSYDKESVKEGFAEFMRNYMTNPRHAQEHAPNFFNWFEGWLASEGDTKKKQTIAEVAKDMREWFDQHSSDKFNSKVGDTKNPNNLAARRTARFRQAVLDDRQGLLDALRMITDSEHEARQVYISARLTLGSQGLVEGIYDIGAPVYDAEKGEVAFQGKGFKEIIAPVAADSKTLGDWIHYAVAKRANELKKQGRENLLTQQEIDDGLQKGEGNPEFEQAFEEYQVWNRRLVEFAVEYGQILTPDVLEKWDFVQYLPFYRVFEKGPQKAPTQKRPGEFTGIKRLTGGTSNLNDIIDNISRNASMLIDASVKNHALMEITDFFETKEHGGLFISKAPKGAKPVYLDKHQMGKWLDELGIDDKGEFEDVDQWIPFWQYGVSPKGGSIYAVMRGGKPEYYEVSDPLLMRSLTALSGRHRTIQRKLWNALRSFKQAGITLAPQFQVAASIRDMMNTHVFSELDDTSLLKAIRGWGKGYIAAFTKNKLYADYMANLGGYGTRRFNRRAVERDAAKFYTKNGINFKFVVHSVPKMFNLLRHLGQTTELAGRLGMYSMALEAGKTMPESAFLGRETNVDFAMRGDNGIVGLFYDTVPFLKAGAVSTDRGFRGLFQQANKEKVAMKAAQYVFLSLMLYATNREKEEYAKEEDWVKDLHWPIYLYEDTDGGFHYFRPEDQEIKTVHKWYIPKLWEIGAMTSMAERGYEWLATEIERRNGLEDKPAERRSSTLNMLLDMYRLDVLPIGVSTIYELGANKNTFTNRPIEPPGQQRLPKWARSTIYSSPALKSLGETDIYRNLPPPAQLSPLELQHVIYSLSGTMGMYALGAADFFASDPKKRPPGGFKELSVVRRFYKEGEPTYTKYGSRFYEMLKTANEVHAAAKKFEDQNRPELAEDQATSLENEWYPVLNDANNELRELSNEYEAIILDESLSADRKRELLNEITVARNTIFEEAVREAEEIKQERKK